MCLQTFHSWFMRTWKMLFDGGIRHQEEKESISHCLIRAMKGFKGKMKHFQKQGKVDPPSNKHSDIHQHLWLRPMIQKNKISDLKKQVRQTPTYRMHVINKQRCNLLWVMVINHQQSLIRVCTVVTEKPHDSTHRAMNDVDLCRFLFYWHFVWDTVWLRLHEINF